MCGIIGSPSLSQAIPLATALKSRGTRAWSLNVINLDILDIVHAQSEAYAFDASAVTSFVTEVDNPFYIFHLQSPTAENYQFHPATLHIANTDHFLWHNGMIDSSEHVKYNRTWDTQLLLELLVGEDGEPHFEKLEEFQGSFACYYLKRGVGLYAFRNRISPQFYDEATNTYASMLSSPTTQRLEPGKVYALPSHEIVTSFENSYNPFGV